VVSDIRANNYGAAVGEVFDTVQDISSCQDGDPRDICSADSRAVYRFLQALAVYSVDSLTANASGVSAEADFRAAAVNLIERFAGEGVRRKLLTRRVQWLYLPELDLRYAWRPGHIGRSSDPLLVYPSIDLVRGRIVIKNASTYLSVSGSLLDPLGPIVEVATRNDALGSDPLRTNVFWLGFLVPRADIEFGVPDLTKNLVIGAGAAFRFFRAQSGTATTPPSYCLMFSHCGQSSIQDANWNNAELSLFVKYVP
jgi:hypothetical protein